MDSFSYLIVFYSLILGLALAELLGGFALMVRAHALKKLEAQTALMAILILICIITEWIDAWNTMKSVTVDLGGLAVPILLAISYYLAAAVVFPHREADHERLADYYQDRRPFVAGALVAAVVLDNITYLHIYTHDLQERPAIFWLWQLPYNLAIATSFIALLFVRSRRANIGFLVMAILLLTVPYWQNQYMGHVIARHYGYPD
jgi:peptidoglycan/LPS O-acetylase OafA/YrhL